MRIPYSRGIHNGSHDVRPRRGNHSASRQSGAPMERFEVGGSSARHSRGRRERGVTRRSSQSPRRVAGIDAPHTHSSADVGTRAARTASSQHCAAPCERMTNKAMRTDDSALSDDDEHAGLARHLDTGFLINALVPGTREDHRLRRWIREGLVVAMSSIGWAEFLCGPVSEEDRQRARKKCRRRFRTGPFRRPELVRRDGCVMGEREAVRTSGCLRAGWPDRTAP